MQTGDGEVTLNCEGRKLAATLFRPPALEKPTKALLFLHGYGSDRTGYLQRGAAAADALGAISLAFDLGGHGESEGVRGDLTIADHFKEVQAAFDFLANLLPEPQVGVCGASYGAYLAAILPAFRPVWRLLLRAPALYPDIEFHRYPRGDTHRSSAIGDFGMLAASSVAFKGQVLIVESAFDDVISPNMINGYIRAFDGAERSIIEAGHPLITPQQKQTFLAIILDWFGAA
jgi:pimeloyl-ACP methyl ester carboxylesterase